MEFDRFSIVLLIRPENAAKLEPEAEDALQDAHLALLARLHDAGQLVAAGPVLGPPDRKLRGVSIMSVDPAQALELKSVDPAVQAGLLRLEVHPWMVPAGAIAFSPVRFPRSRADVEA